VPKTLQGFRDEVTGLRQRAEQASRRNKGRRYPVTGATLVADYCLKLPCALKFQLVSAHIAQSASSASLFPKCPGRESNTEECS
jgi:hypothetical protein